MFYTDFCSDAEKMRDFFLLTKKEFLNSYSYLTEEEYDLTVEAVKTVNFFNNREDNKEKENAKMENKLASSTRIAVDAVKTAEIASSQLKIESDMKIAADGSDIQTQIAEYILHVLEESDYTEFDYTCAHCIGSSCFPGGGATIRVSKNGYVYNRTHWDAQLHVNSKAQTYALLFSRENDCWVVSHGGAGNAAFDFLVKHWKEMKAGINGAIERSIAQRAAAAKKKVAEVLDRENLYKNWEL